MNTDDVFRLPPQPEITPVDREDSVAVQELRYSGFGLSLQGSSHIVKNVPCQDSHTLRYIPGADLIVAAISDGVGSCPLSHWGSHIAVETASEYVSAQLIRQSGGTPYSLADDEFLYRCLLDAFHAAVDEIERTAEANECAAEELHCTLTLALYDGSTLWYCHAGDDGIVIQFEDGFVKQVTKRQKGEEASSVYPLQSGEGCWQIGKVASKLHGAAVAFAMATDGVLDAFSFDDEIYREAEGCCTGVYYPFIGRAFYGNESSVQRCEEYRTLMNSESYRSRVTDDLTLVAVICPQALDKAEKPGFSMEAWTKAGEELAKRRHAALYGEMPEPTAEPIELETEDTFEMPEPDTIYVELEPQRSALDELRELFRRRK